MGMFPDEQKKSNFYLIQLRFVSSGVTNYAMCTLANQVRLSCKILYLWQGKARFLSQKQLLYRQLKTVEFLLRLIEKML